MLSFSFYSRTQCGNFYRIRQVASTNWKRVMLMLTGKMNVTRLEDLRSFDVHHQLQNSHLVQLNRFEPDRIRTRLDTYFKFLFVRHPLERIVSAYENKFNTPYDSYFQVRYGRLLFGLKWFLFSIFPLKRTVCTVFHMGTIIKSSEIFLDLLVCGRRCTTCAFSPPLGQLDELVEVKSNQSKTMLME